MKPHWDFPRHIASTRILVGLGRENGLSITDCLTASGLCAQDIEQADLIIEATQELQVIRNLMRHLGPDQGLGLDAGQRYHPTTFGIWGFALQSSPTVWKAVEVGIRFTRLTSVFCQPRTAQNETQALLICDDAGVPDDVRDFLVERDCAMIAQLQRDVMGMQLPLTQLTFRRATPTYADKFEAVFGMRPQFEQARNLVCISTEIAQMPLPQGDVFAFKLCESECLKLLERRKLRGGIAGQIRDQLLLHSRNMPSMTEMAANLKLSVRTLRRRLSNEQVDYASLTEAVRRMLAEELLHTTDMTMEDIAERLGYSEPSCFSRAFKRWSGQAPLAYRQAQATSLRR